MKLEPGRNRARIVVVDGREAVEIELTQGQIALCDIKDWPLVKGYAWYATRKKDGQYYAQAALPGTTRKLRMHRLIFGGQGDVDHSRGDGLDNRRSCLRDCNQQLNQMNSCSRGGSSRFKNVSWINRKQKYLVQFNALGKTHSVGYFDDEEEAARARDARIRELGLAAWNSMNFPEPGERAATTGQVRREPGETKKRFGTSRYRGVWFHKAEGRWESAFHVGKKRVRVGFFDTEEEAAIAYDRRVREVRGQDARTNFVYTRAVPIWPVPDVPFSCSP